MISLRKMCQLILTISFRPHITLIRKAKGNWSEQSAPKGEMQVFRISLMKSERIDGKMVYTEIYEKHLKAY